MSTPTTTRKLSTFTGRGYDKGAHPLKIAAWVTIGDTITRSILCPPKLRATILRAFGATIAPHVLIRHNVRIHWPWKLTIGEHTWIGVGAWILNLEPVTIGSNVVISQEAMLCTGSHHANDPAFEFDNAPITIEDGAWIATRATILRGVTIGTGATIGATTLVTKNVPPNTRVLAPLPIHHTPHTTEESTR
ncbi:DapH/DapD/GlmU-related protein [Dermatophilus congolensis]|uniref:Putative acetyltransferase SACOL2570 n=1 Tax=Dermatophilus congolensis TaxID=1863 RepID=A0A239VT77_9MICO|nr:DapH/DapD/GlmU-related protein [Dermatophilus congolensis]MBO3129873.1 putative colanic acid biosynthesis acetyltransferase [Dermatophilus congolensis]MBO3131499.1 putative colanic acid biosynthesis acetyltransferase [Dermatophilus congolensis]MBO3134348.1 putative colanic acid biosynthesis acetyltransferase [Dermatophilus congolensis]MBO3136582.1 putative colanic acid biosynthesis acetyltransferase [Dermatophilus congolensis]MBO3138826.1 putative colanic acid biosynthesis acetyltransferase